MTGFSSAENQAEQTGPSIPGWSEGLIYTKLFLPPIRHCLVDRPRLLRELNSGLEKSVILVSAPAGYGKTTLVRSWLDRTNLPAAWISLDEGDNDPLRFLQYLLLALQQVIPAIQPEMLSNLRGPTSFEPLLATLTRAIGEFSKPLLLVMDDLHVLQAQPALDFLAALIAHSPPNLHVVLVSRSDPFLPLPLFRVRNQVLEVRADQLRFTQDEIQAFIHEVMSLELSRADIQSLHNRTEGWIAGIQLAALSLQHCDDVHAFIAAFAGSHRYIIDYLTEEVLKRQPDEVRAFLLQSSVLERMCGSLCEAVVEPPARHTTSAQAMLEQLDRQNLFVVPLDGERRWYRYHHLFSDMLQQRLEAQYPQLVPQLHLCAARWYEQNGFIPEAIEHLLKAKDMRRARQLIVQNGVLLLVRGEVNTLLKWIDRVEPYSRNQAWLYIFKAWIYALNGEVDQVEPALQIAEPMVSSLQPSSQVQLMKGTILAARAHCCNSIGESAKAAELARQALDTLPCNGLISLSLRAVATSQLGDATWVTGELEEAHHAYLESARLCQAAGDTHLTIIINSNLGNILVELGKLREAEKIYSDTLALATRSDGQRALIAGRLLVDLSQVYYEWNQLSEANQCAQQSLVLCRQWGNMDLLAVSHTQLARLEYQNAHLKEAKEAARAAEQLLNDYDIAQRYSFWVKSILANLATRRGEFEHASQLVQSSGIRPDIYTGEIKIPYLLESMALAWARLLLVQGDLDHCWLLCQRVHDQAEANHRTGRIIEALVVKSLAHLAAKDMGKALESMGAALRLAPTEGYMRTFLDEGEPMTKLLYQAKVRRIGGSFASELLASYDTHSTESAASSLVLVEPLTGRESEVFKLIQIGSTNQEIAEKLVISIPTVKRHISNIYAKLGAKNRTQAISLGKTLNLLD